MSLHRVGIIGAGVAGLTCARQLSKSKDISVTVFEKSRVLGGRCATKIWADSRIDHGVHSFTLESPQARHLLFEDLKLDETQIHKFPENTFAKPYPDSSYALDRYYFPSGNNFIGTALAKGLNIIHGAQVRHVSSSARILYQLDNDQLSKEMSDQFDLVLCTIPLPQAATVLDVPKRIKDQWLASYSPNLTALLQYDLDSIPSTSPIHEAVNRSAPSFYYCNTTIGHLTTWCENAKQNRQLASSTAVLVTQAPVGFSAEHLENDNWLPAIREITEDVWQIPKNALIQSFSKRWRYARVTSNIDYSGLHNHLGNKILLAGDGIAGKSSVEDAILDGFRVANNIRTQLH